MLPFLIIHPQISDRLKEIERLLDNHHLFKNHANVLFLEEESKLGIAEVTKIRNHLNLRPYQDGEQAVVVAAAQNFTPEAQNSLLKTLEEPAGDSLIILAAQSQEQLLPTIVSRCQVIILYDNSNSQPFLEKYQTEILKMIESKIDQRFKFIDKVTEKEEFLKALTAFFRNQLLQKPDNKISSFLQTLVWAKKLWQQNVNQRAILEYLMLRLPKGKED